MVIQPSNNASTRNEYCKLTRRDIPPSKGGPIITPIYPMEDTKAMASAELIPSIQLPAIEIHVG